MGYSLSEENVPVNSTADYMLFVIVIVVAYNFASTEKKEVDES